MRAICLASLVLAGCTTTPSASDLCLMESWPSWRTIQVPPQRDEFMRLISGNGTLPVEKRLALRMDEREAWFRNRDGRIRVCAYTPNKDVCSDGRSRSIEFRQQGTAWVAQELLEGVCVVVSSRR